MATRRQLGLGGEREVEGEEYGSANYDGGFDFGAFAESRQPDFGQPSAPPPVGNQDPFGNGQDRPDAFFELSPEEQQAIIDLQQGAIGGNQESARELFGGGRPTTGAAQQPQLPQGVSVEERSAPEQHFAQDTPPMSMSPAPVSAGTTMPMQTSVAQGPQRRSVSNAAPALFSQDAGPSMFGDAGGLMGGGRGVVGASGGGPTPTEMMLAIMRSMRGGG